MIFENSQDSWEINLPSHVKSIGLKISGGADSAIVCYMLAKYVTEERPDIVIHPVTCISNIKPYQQIFADKVLRKVEELTGIVFAKHQYTVVRAETSELYVSDQPAFIKTLYDQNLFILHFAGITANPTIEEAPHLYGDIRRMPSDDRSKQIVKKDNWRLPLINVDKRGVAEHYIRLGVLDKIFPLTRSCEEVTLGPFDRHCEKCWFCEERQWGFGRFV